MLINLNDVALKNGVTLNKVFQVLAMNNLLLDNVKFINFDSKNPMIDSSSVWNIDFYCEVVPKEEKLRVKVMVGMMKEIMEVNKAKAKILKEVYKALGFIRKKFDVNPSLSEEEIINMVNELYDDGIEGEDIKLAIFNQLCILTADEDVYTYYNMLLEEHQEARRIKEEIIKSLTNSPKIDEETGEIIE